MNYVRKIDGIFLFLQKLQKYFSLYHEMIVCAGIIEAQAGIMHTDSYYLNEENLLELKADPTVSFNDQIDSMIYYKKWFFGHWHSNWGYENYKTSEYVPLYHMGITI